jgi:integrase
MKLARNRQSSDRQTWLDSAGASMSVQRDLMRHASIQTTADVYGRATMSDAKREAHGKVVKMALKPVLDLGKATIRGVVQ